MTFHWKPKVYFAAPLFNDMERRFNAELSVQLEEFVEIFLPQRDGGLMAKMIADGIPPTVAARSVFQMDINALNQCDGLIIVLDGRTVDEGAAFELGYAHALGKACFGLQTDVRRLLATGNNPMIDSCLDRTFLRVDELLSWASRSAQTDFADKNAGVFALVNS